MQLSTKSFIISFQDLFSAGCVKHKPMVEVFDAAVREAMPDKPKSEVRIMDLGAGTGLLGVELNKLGYINVDALDVTQRMLDEAKKKKVYTKFICTPLTEERTPGIETGEYNAIISSGVVSAAYGHVRPPALLEMIRVVSEGECAPALSLQHPLFRRFLTIVMSIAFLVEPTSATSSRKRFFLVYFFFHLRKT